MEHEERLTLANEATKALLNKYGERILYVGLSGSTAKNEDKENSDIDMVVVTKTKNGHLLCVLKGIVFSVDFLSLKFAEKLTKSVSATWPLEVGQILGSVKLYDNNFLENFNKEIKSVENKKFAKAAKKILPDLREDIDKLKNKYAIKNRGDVNGVADLFYYEANNFIAIINKAWLTRTDSGSLIDIEKLSKKPKNYIQLFTKLRENNNIDEVYSITLELWRNLLEFAEENGIKLKEYKEIDDISL